MSVIRTCAAITTAAAIAGCAALEPARAPVPDAPAFDLVGRVAASHDGRVFSSGIRWEHVGQRDEIWLLTPTGQALAHIVGEAGRATLTGADRSEFQAGDIESLTRKALGWELPVTRLAWWARAGIVPAGVIGEVLRDEQGRLVRLRQDGWLITLFHRDGNEGGGLPRRLELTRDAYKIRLVIDNWRDATAGP